MVVFAGELHGAPGSPIDRFSHGDFSLDPGEVANLEIILRSKIGLCGRNDPELAAIGQLLNFIRVHPVRWNVTPQLS
jgi:hypothetical protein